MQRLPVTLQCTLATVRCLPKIGQVFHLFRNRSQALKMDGDVCVCVRVCVCVCVGGGGGGGGGV